MLKFTLDTADISEYGKIAAFLKANGLEFSDEQLKAPASDMLKMWKVTQGLKNQSDDIVAACILCSRKGYYVVSDIAVDWPMRKSGLGRLLMKKAENEVKKLGGNEIWLVAKVPEFYEKLGYKRMTFDASPDLFSCAHCDHNGNDCFPVVMTKSLV